MKIYVITNLINNKKYVGQTGMSIEKRFYYHRVNSNKNSLITMAIRKYGKENFKLEELEITDCQDTLNYLETYYIKKLNTHSSAGGYNLTFGGENPPKTTKESAAKGGRRRYKPVIATNLATGEQIWYISIKLAVLDGFKKTSISFCCRFPNKRKSHLGYKWEFVDKKHVTSYDNYKPRKIKYKKRTVEQCLHMSIIMTKIKQSKIKKQILGINIITNEQLIFNGSIEASNILKIPVNSINNVLNKRSKTAGNYKFNYLNQEV